MLINIGTTSSMDLWKFPSAPSSKELAVTFNLQTTLCYSGQPKREREGNSRI